MSYNPRSGHGYGQQQRRWNGRSGRNRNQRSKSVGLDNNNNFVVLPNQPLDNSSELTQPSDDSIPIFIKAKESWSSDGWTFQLPNNQDPELQAYSIAAIASRRKIELILNGPDNQPIKKYLIEKRTVETDPEKQTPEVDTIDTIVPTCLSALKQHLAGFGFVLKEVKV